MPRSKRMILVEALALLVVAGAASGAETEPLALQKAGTPALFAISTGP